MYCKNCGKEISNDSRFCNFCGVDNTLETSDTKQISKTFERDYGCVCPKCGSRNLMSTSRQTNGVYESCYACKECRHVFRDRKDIAEDIERFSSAIKRKIIIFLIVLATLGFQIYALIEDLDIPSESVTANTIWLFGIITSAIALCVNIRRCYTCRSMAEDELSDFDIGQRVSNNSDTWNGNGITGWKCPMCGRVNANYVGTCGCGTKKQ